MQKVADQTASTPQVAAVPRSRYKSVGFEKPAGPKIHNGCRSRSPSPETARQVPLRASFFLSSWQRLQDAANPLAATPLAKLTSRCAHTRPCAGNAEQQNTARGARTGAPSATCTGPTRPRPCAGWGLWPAGRVRLAAMTDIMPRSPTGPKARFKSHAPPPQLTPSGISLSSVVSCSGDQTGMALDDRDGLRGEFRL